MAASSRIVLDHLIPLLYDKGKRVSTVAQGFAFIDLFAGIGGLRQAMESIGGQCLYTSEWDKFAKLTYEANYRDNRPMAGDIQQIEAGLIPEHDVLCAGFPCQPFSLAGVSKKNSLGRAHGFLDETQGTLFFDVVRILKHRRPAAFMLENVKNLRSHDKGKTFDVIIGALKELGYKISVEVIDARHFLPQHRQRIVIVGFLHDTGFDFANLILAPKGQVKLGSILHPEDGSEVSEGHFTLGPDAIVNPKYTLSDHLWQYLQNYKEKHAKAGNGFGCSVVGVNDVSRTLSARYHKDGSEILIDQGRGKNPRRLTPRECARLMGYDDSFKIPVSDTQAYRQFGNSVAVPVFKAVAKIMAPHIALSLNARKCVAV
ncbi:MAG: DNA (cytosine-5-)-methyltransferase [Sulfitobacter sp.]